MKRLTILIILGLLLLLGACQEGSVIPSTPPPTFTPTSAPTTGNISGIVTEKGTGIPLEGVIVELYGPISSSIEIFGKKYEIYLKRSIGVSIVVITDKNGTYSISDLEPGTYTLTFRKEGYKTKRVQVSIIDGENVTQNIELEDSRNIIRLDITKDTTIHNKFINRIPSGSPGDLSTLTLEYEEDSTGLKVERILLEFNFDSLPQDAKIISAKLYLYAVESTVESDFALSYSVYPLTEEWDEISATWEQSASSSWSVPGGTYDEEFRILEGKIESGGWFTWKSFNITKAFEYWESHPNYGIIFIPEDVTRDNGIVKSFHVVFNSKEADSHKPYVEIEYYIP